MAEEMITLDTLKMAAEIVKKGTGVKNLVRIPPRLYQAHPEAYTPLLVSIGPFHYIGRYSKLIQGSKNRFNNVNILAMETMKQASLLEFMSSHNLRDPSPGHRERYGPLNANDVDPNVSNPPDASEIVTHADNPPEQKILERCQQLVRENLDEIWDLYREEIEISPEILANIILVDSCFLLNFLVHDDPSPNGEFSALRGDLVLLENQIPFFVLVGLSKMLDVFHLDDYRLEKLILKTFELCPKSLGPPAYLLSSDNLWNSIHLLDFIHHFHVVKKTLFFRTTSIEIDPSRAMHVRNATRLRASGVTIECASGGSFSSVLSLSFCGGVLSIPPLLLSDYTEKLFINLLAHEHLSPNRRGHFTSYVFFMSQLIESKEDLQLLVKKGIIHNQLGNREDVSKLFSNVTKQFVLRDFLYWDLCYEIEAYADSTWQRHIQVLKERYFSNPWTTLSVFAATILLLLTFMQTFYTALSYYQGVHPK